MDNGEWDLMAIVHSCKATTFTNPPSTFETSPPKTPITTTTTTTTTNNGIFTQNTIPSYFNDFTVIQENHPVPVTPLKSTDFIDLEKLKINFNHNNTLDIPTTISPNPTTSSLISTTTTPTSSTTIIPTYITAAPFESVYNHQLIPQQPLRQHNQLPILQPQTPITTNNIIRPQNTTPSYFNDFTVIQENNSVPISPFKQTNYIDLEKFRFNFNPLQIPTLNPNSTTITTPTIITTPTTSIPTLIPTTNIFSPNSAITIPASSTTTLLTHIPTSHFDRAYNHPSVPQQLPRHHNQLPNLQPETSSRVLPNINPQQPKCKSRKR
ncbi:mucin-2-like [Trifolium pratense]|uniref:mucin-2-like n=1 Tax=Trifolium pratense TaxID=57577 RepID=UPI001E69763E|nr:mucin-2-like [Trifolium pratense]